jgi:hypothetical protein
MKIYFTCTTAQFDKYKDVYWDMRKFLVDEGHLLTLDWMPEVYKKNEAGVTEVRDIEKIYKNCIDAIWDSEMVIVEDTVSNFSTGHQITIAIKRKKPTLVLWEKDKQRQFNDSFINGIESDFLEVHQYQGQEYKSIIKTFINKYADAKIKNRFHLVLNNVERNYLDWANHKRNKSRTRIIRDALNDVIDHDEEYNEYLRGESLRG